MSEEGKTLTDAISGAVTITVAKRKLTFEWNFSAIALAEKATGENLLISSLNFQEMSASKYVGLLYASLSTHQPDMSLADASRLVKSPKTWEKLTGAMMAAWKRSQDEDNEDDDEGETGNPPTPDAQ